MGAIPVDADRSGKFATWTDQYGRLHVIVPMSAPDPRQLATDCMILLKAKRNRMQGETETEAIGRWAQELNRADRVVLAIWAEDQHPDLNKLGGMAEYLDQL
jgi:hypothetical protein